MRLLNCVAYFRNLMACESLDLFTSESCSARVAGRADDTRTLSTCRAHQTLPAASASSSDHAEAGGTAGAGEAGAASAALRSGGAVTTLATRVTSGAVAAGGTSAT